MAEVAYIDNEVSPRKSQTDDVNDHKPDVKRGRPRKFSTDEERKQHTEDNKYNLQYYHKKLIIPYKCTICGSVCNSATALRIHKNSNNKCKILKETM